MASVSEMATKRCSIPVQAPQGATPEPDSISMTIITRAWEIVRGPIVVQPSQR
jgi:hypothetical protein